MSLDFEITSGTESRVLAATWRELESRADPHFFLSWDWIGCWIAQASREPLVLIGRTSAKIVLLGLLTPSKRSELVVWSTHGFHVHATGNESEDVITIEYNGFLVDRNWQGRAEQEAIAFLTRGLCAAGRRRDEVHLRGVAAAYEAFAPPLSLAQVVARKPSYRVDLASVRATGRPYCDRLSANTRQQIRRSLRIYERRGNIATTRARNLCEASQFLDELKQLHQCRWNSRGEPGGFGHPFFEAFVRRLTETCLPRGSVELMRISCGGEAIGYLYNFTYRKHVYFYLGGLLYEGDPKLKPGRVSHFLCIERHLNEGSQVYDFMAGSARYKASLGEPGPDMLYLIVQRPTAALRLEQGLRDLKGTLDSIRRRIASSSSANGIPTGPLPDRQGSATDAQAWEPAQ
jgi:CelD/BcsL family acetyltransferase involved in cellulose biosynthesis